MTNETPFTEETIRKELDDKFDALPEDARRQGQIVIEALEDTDLMAKMLAYNIMAINNRLQSLSDAVGKHNQALELLATVEKIKALTDGN